jgi:hypothetical protein
MLVRCPVDLSKLKRVIGQIVVVQAEVYINEDISFCKISRYKKIINVPGKPKGQSTETDSIGWAQGTERGGTKQKHNT